MFIPHDSDAEFVRKFVLSIRSNLVRDRVTSTSGIGTYHVASGNLIGDVAHAFGIHCHYANRGITFIIHRFERLDRNEPGCGANRFVERPPRYPLCQSRPLLDRGRQALDLVFAHSVFGKFLVECLFSENGTLQNNAFHIRVSLLPFLVSQLALGDILRKVVPHQTDRGPLPNRRNVGTHRLDERILIGQRSRLAPSLVVRLQCDQRCALHYVEIFLCANCTTRAFLQPLIDHTSNHAFSIVGWSFDRIRSRCRGSLLSIGCRERGRAER